MAKHLADGISHLRPRTAVLRGARWAWSLTCGVWGVDTLSERLVFSYTDRPASAYTCYQIGSLHASHFVRPRTAVLMRAVPVGRAEPLA
jgi:hypothetical protein